MATYWATRIRHFVNKRDTVVQSCVPLLVGFISSLAQRVERVHIICFDRHPQQFRDAVPQQFQNKLVFHDGTKDILGISPETQLSLQTNIPQYLNSVAGQPGCQAYHSVAVVIDNLSLSLLHRGAPYTCQTLAQIRETKIQGADVEQVVCSLHSDLHDNISLSLVEHLATTVVKVTEPKMDQFFMAANILHKRQSGKVIRTMEHFNINDQYGVFNVTEVKSVSATPSVMDSKQPDPTANLTFNLTLTDKEKEARSQVKLPYTYDREKQDDRLLKSVGEGKIFYQPDEADDFDEEDPDDDLDI
ncbi:elongator complex protein 5-like isoform X2 [Dreissena polymorpha]|uniref:elongator complex protein 5-like isoform X2 n=1 Tax=Dreissena polymorpha TaxID=45954 RepID=UPI0022643D3E|nr:elongator complex protein 5-like isoform X2 [Dreissena polymorpha]